MRHTFLRILSNYLFPTTQDFPLQFQIADGDGSESDTVYNQTTTYTETKSFILFCIRPIKITGCGCNILWKNLNPNSLITQGPNFLHAAKENQENIKLFMFDIINSDTEQKQNEGLYIDNDLHVKVEVVCSMFDGKMAAILSGAGGACCQLCTATFNQIKDLDLIIQGFPINRHISDALQLLGDLEDFPWVNITPTLH